MHDSLFDAPKPEPKNEPPPQAKPAAAPEAESNAEKPPEDGEKKLRESKTQWIAREIELLTRRLAEGEIDDIRTRVAYVLNQYPYCRNSDVELIIRYWKLFHSDEIGSNYIEFDAMRSVTPASSIIRARATIQNTYKLFKPDDEVAEMRKERQQDVRQRQIAAVQQSLPLVHVYCDESGKTDSHYVIGSMWVNDVDNQAFNLQNSLVSWRKSIEWKNEFHFADVTSQRQSNYLNLIKQAMAASDYVGFKAVILARSEVKKRPTEDAIYNLYYRLVVDGVSHEVERNRFALPRAVIVHKDEDEGADKIHLLALRDKLKVECPKNFDNLVTVQMATPMKSATHILMQLVDVFTGAVNRIVNRSATAQRNHKDELAESILDLLGANWRKIDKDISGDFLRIIRL